MEDNQKRDCRWRSDVARRQEAEVPAPAPPDAQSQTAPKKEDRYQDGMVIWQTPDDDAVPFLLKFNLNTQFRYLNTQSSDDDVHRSSRQCPRRSYAQ